MWRVSALNLNRPADIRLPGGLRRIAGIATPKSILRRSSNPGEGPRLTVVSLDTIVKLHPSWLRWETAGRLHSPPMSKFWDEVNAPASLTAGFQRSGTQKIFTITDFHKRHHDHIFPNQSKPRWSDHGLLSELPARTSSLWRTLRPEEPSLLECRPIESDTRSPQTWSCRSRPSDILEAVARLLVPSG
jgi:hypothetical protein